MAFPFSIESREFPGVFLQVAEPDKGSRPSSVSLSNPVTDAGRLFVLMAKGDDVWAIQCVKFPGFFLFLDGTQVADVPKGTYPTGAGKVWVSDVLTDFAKFRLVPNLPLGGYNIQSAATAQSFLRLDGAKVQQNGLPGGIINVQNSAGRYEAFNIAYFPAGAYHITTTAAEKPEKSIEESEKPYGAGGWLQCCQMFQEQLACMDMCTQTRHFDHNVATISPLLPNAASFLPCLHL